MERPMGQLMGQSRSTETGRLKTACLATRRGGGTGRHKGLKIPSGFPGTGSNPVPGIFSSPTDEAVMPTGEMGAQSSKKRRLSLFYATSGSSRAEAQLGVFGRGPRPSRIRS